MWYQWIASNYNDSDLTENNIRDGVEIFGVEGNFEGLTSGWLGNYIWSVSWSTASTILVPGVRAIEFWDYVYFFCCFWMVWWGMWLFASKIHKETLEITIIGYLTQSWTWAGQHYIHNSYIDWTDIYINFWNTWPFWEHIKLDTLTDTLSWASSKYEIWTIDNSTSKIIWWKTYTPNMNPATQDGWWGVLIAYISIS